MAESDISATLMRERGEGGGRVTNFELFFDLVYVFAVTQLAYLLRDYLTLLGALQTLIILLAVWWAWIYTVWVTNWFDPERLPVRVLLIGIMLLSLIMSATLPSAFDERGLYFAGAYVAIQVGRSLVVVSWLGSQPGLRRNFQRILAWSMAGGVLWLAGGFLTGSARVVLWLIAVLVDCAAPATGFFTPGLGRSRTTDWTIEGSHLAERCQLFLIIALGESILDTGATFGDITWSTLRVVAMGSAFIGTAALWWLYFYRSAEGGSRLISTAADPGRLGRSAYTYFHLPMVAGIIVSAVADERVIAHPAGPIRATAVVVIVGGPALFLAGHALYKWALTGRLYHSRVLGLVALGVLAAAGFAAPPVLLAGLASLVLVAVAGWETWTAGTAYQEAEGAEPRATQSVT
jgi:low temperature requirement protein LtrA